MAGEPVVTEHSSATITAGEARDDPWLLHDHPVFKETDRLSTFLLYAMARSTWALGYTEAKPDQDALACYAFGPDGSEVLWRYDAGAPQEDRRVLNALFRAARRKGNLRRVDAI